MRRENSSLYETEKTKQVISISHAEPRGKTQIRMLERSVLNQRIKIYMIIDLTFSDLRSMTFI